MTLIELVTASAEVQASELFIRRSYEQRLRRDLEQCLLEQRTQLQDLVECIELLTLRVPNTDWCAHFGVVKRNGAYAMADETPERFAQPLSWDDPEYPHP